MSTKNDKASFTPGPWVARDTTEVFGMVDIMAGETWVAVAQAGPDIAWAEANARLIAAAPELLAALKAMHKRFITESEWITASDEALESVNIALIAKAEGRE